MSVNEKDQKNVGSDNAIEISAKTVEEAIEQGLAQLNLTQVEVEVQVLKEGKRGVFGLGAEDALVRLTPKETVVDEPAPASPEVIVETSSPEPQVEETSVPSDDDVEPSPEKIAKKYLSGLLERMDIRADVVFGDATDLAEPGEEPPLVLDITGADLGILIGRRSETLRALQYMLRLMVSKELGRWYPVIVDVESYRVRRRQSLRQLAEKMAKKVESTRRKVVLEAMPAYERRIIHLTLRDHPTVFTKSVGSDDNRKVTILPK